ncbi:multidrug resistance-associated protein 1 [Trichonephila clavata]|uniref:ABC-type glutathione-S-conjugate transporter n=1 Tax=Trichonephila clavata TaxID=2740835 RepID=A0A8X6HUL7_TRICU|nr:multidrug resistance-associated protein 1 [Trichonephila clavata]
MDQICSTEFWNWNLTWSTTTPIFTSCFIKIGLIWAPIAFFWIFAPAEIYYMIWKKGTKVPWSNLNISKLVVVFLLMVLSLVEIIYQMVKFTKADVRPVEYYTPFLIFVTMAAVAMMLIIQRRKGKITSGVLFLFSFFFCLGTAGGYYTALQKTFNENFIYDKEYETFQFSMIVLYFALSFILFILNCFADMRLKPSQIPKRQSPEERASFLSLLTFWWFNPMAVLGYRKPLSGEDMWELRDDNKSESLQAQFDKYWLPVAKKINSHQNKVKVSYSRRYSEMPADDCTKVTISPDDYEKDISKLSIFKPILKTFGLQLFGAGLLKLGASVITFVNPIILDELIAFVGSNDPYWKGFIFAAGMFLAALIESFLSGQYEYQIYVIAMRIRSCIISVVYKKALVLSNSARKNFTVGEVVNLMSVDTQRMMDYVQMVNLLWAAPLQIVIAIYLLWQQLGIATLGGLFVMILMIPLNGVISVFIRNFQVRLMKDKDQRTKLMNEIMNGIKVLKLYAWENSFIKEVMKFRGMEVASLKAQAYLNGAVTFVFSSAPFLVSLASFATYVLIDSANVLDANKAFVSLSLFNILRVPTALLPMIITYTAMFVVSLKRINKYLQGEEIDPDIVNHDPSEKDPVVVENATFSWTKEDAPALSNLNFRAPEGKLVAVVGQVGAGKSSLLSALLGDMVKWCGKVNVKGSVAYVPQQAWIQNATLRKNVLFTKSFDDKKYKTVLEACALAQDLEILPGGDMTEIGEKGINLSGGQKQRVSLARAVYSDADIYYLDDPLSAVDAHVGKHIFEHVIGPEGLLQKKTRILVTHRISVLPDVDTIVVLVNGQVSEMGSYRELLAKKGAFADFLIQYLQENATENTEQILPDELNLIQEIAATVGAPPEITRQLSKISDGESDSDSVMKIKRGMSLTSPESGEGPRRRTKSQMDTPDKMGNLRRDSVRNSTENLKRRSSKTPVAGTNLTEKESMAVGSVKSSVYFDYIKSYGYWNSFWTVICFILSNGFSVGSSLWLSVWSNDSLNPDSASDTHLRDVRLGVYSGLGGGEIVFTLITSILMNLACLRAARILHDGMLEHIMRAPMSFFDTTPLGRILNRFSKDIDTADITIRFNIRMLFIQGFRALGAVIVISLETPFFLLACLPLIILYYFLQKFYIPTSRQLKRLESTTRSPVYSHFSETVTGASSIRAYEASNIFMTHSNNLVDINHESYYPSLGASRWLSIRLEFLGYSIVFLAALFAVFLRDTLSPGIAGLSVSYALQVTGILNMLVRATADVETNIVAVERCLEYTKTPVEAEWYNKKTKPDDAWPQEGQIKFDNYSTRYREGLELVLKEITCVIKPRERVGIVGRTGAGKSSLTLALFRIIEAAKGKISIDGVHIAKLGLHDLRNKLTIIPQDPVLFTGTLRSNLDPFGSYSDQALWQSLEQSHLKSFVSSLEKGMEHEVSEGGENLSVGQRQLVCLARALLRKTKVLILDEATAAVDVETDELIQSTIRTQFDDCTVLTIAHRLNTIMDYDKVIVLSKGEIVEMDKPENLLKREDSIFYSMAKDAGLI